MKRALLVTAIVLFAAFWGAASWIGGRLYGCEPPTCQLWRDGPMLVAAIATVLVVGVVGMVMVARRPKQPTHSG